MHRQYFEYSVSWDISKARLSLPKKTKEKKKEINPKCKSLQPLSSFPNGSKKVKKRWKTPCFSQKDMDKPYSFPRQKKLWLHQENPIKQKVISCWAAQDSWSWSKPLANNTTGQPVFVFCIALDKDRHPQVLLCCNSFIQATEKRHQVHKVNSLS